MSKIFLVVPPDKNRLRRNFVILGFFLKKFDDLLFRQALLVYEISPYLGLEGKNKKSEWGNELKPIAMN